ncbi:MAG: prolipoprotein diacylglyceryl transferase family protein [Gemmataceae bacterium]
MEQVLFWIPIKTVAMPNGIPIYGFGAMLFLAFVVGSWIAGRIGKRIGIPTDKFSDLLIWTFLFGLIGGRVLHIIAETDGRWDTFFRIWEGGLVFYGGAIGGAIGAVVMYLFLMKPLGVSPWQVADVLAPALAIGICFGRLGCFLNGCCYGYVAAPGTLAVHFPALTAPAEEQLVRTGQQTLAGFAMDDRAKDDRTVGYVEASSAAAVAGLKPGDVIVAVNGIEVPTYAALDLLLRSEWPRGETKMALKVRRGTEAVDLPAFTPRLIGLYPTQIYESISTLLLFVALLLTYPRRRFDGQVVALLMIGYAVHRYVVESLRDDTPKDFLGHFTLSQTISFAILAGGLLIIVVRRRYPRAIATAPIATP